MSDSTEFDEAHRAILLTHIPAYEKFILENNPSFKGHSKELKQWREETTKKLMDDDVFFKTLPRSGNLEDRNWQKVGLGRVSLPK